LWQLGREEAVRGARGCGPDARGHDEAAGEPIQAVAEAERPRREAELRFGLEKKMSERDRSTPFERPTRTKKT
jgi:hypothetical protein